MGAPEVLVSDHADLRWMQRADSSHDIEEAWQESEPVHVDTDECHGYPRYHEPSETILVAKNSTLVTVLNAEWTDYEPVSEDHWRHNYNG